MIRIGGNGIDLRNPATDPSSIKDVSTPGKSLSFNDQNNHAFSSVGSGAAGDAAASPSKASSNFLGKVGQI